jgi:VWFA-related protein
MKGREVKPTYWKIAPVLLAVILASGAGAAQVPDTPQATFFAPVDVPLVSIDVYVSEHGGHPVPGLTEQDFEVLEDGVEVEVSHFYASPGVTSTTEGMDESPTVGAPQRGPGQNIFLVIFFDDTNLSRGRRQAAIEYLGSFLSSELPPHLNVMLVRYDGSMHVEQGFSEETDEIIAALTSIRQAASLSRQVDEGMLLREIQNAATMAAISGEEGVEILRSSGNSTWQSIGYFVDETVARTQTCVANLERFIRSLSGLSGRKALIFVSDGVPARPGEGLYRAWSEVFGVVPEFRIDAQRAFVQAAQNDLSGEFDTLAQFANGHRVSFYTVSTLGTLGGRAVSAETRLMDEQELALDQAMSAEVLMANMAGTTGGRPLVNSSGLSDQLEEVSEELASYYSLAFEPNHLGDGQYHRLEIKVKRDNVQVRHREGYRDVPLEERMADKTLAAAVYGHADNSLGITAAVNGEIVARDDGTFLVPVIITVPIGQLVLIPSEDEHRGQISILLLVRDQDGDLSAPVRREYPVAVPNALLTTALTQGAGFTIRLGVGEGRQRIAVGLRDEIAGSDSVTLLELELGDGGDVDS